jgi:hypothetical protein
MPVQAATQLATTLCIYAIRLRDSGNSYFGLPAEGLAGPTRALCARSALILCPLYMSHCDLLSGDA